MGRVNEFSPRDNTTAFHRALPALLAALVAIAVFSVLLPGGFAYDFYGIARSDPRLQNPAAWRTYWTGAYLSGVDNLYRPLTSTAMALQSWLFGLDEHHAWRFHLVSILLHAGASALVAELARRLLNWRAALIAGLLFAAHPIHTEVIADVVGQAEMLCALGTVGAMILFLHRPMTIRRVAAIFACFLLALLSKEQGMLLPGLLLILAICLRCTANAAILAAPAQSAGNVLSYSDLSTSRADQSQRNAMLWLVVLLCFGLGAYVLIRENVLHLKFWWDRGFLDPAINPIKLAHGRDQWLVPIAMLGRYAQLLVCPWKLAPDYGGVAIGSVARFDDPYLYLGIAAIIIWLALCAIALFKRAGVALFCLLGMAITYGLISNLVTIIGTNFAERLMYQPSVFFVILVALALARLPIRPLIPLMVLLLAVASMRSVTYARRWNDRLVLYEQAVLDQPGAIRMYVYLAAEYNQRGDIARAKQTMETAERIMPEYGYLWLVSAKLAIDSNDLDAAERYLRRAESIEISMRAIDLENQLAHKRAATQPSK
jgi:protein O-mannosyl-transferase